MVKPRLFVIQLLNAKPYYLPGSWIEGVVQLRTEVSLSAKAIELKFKGVESASWEESYLEGEGEERHVAQRKCSDKKKLIDTAITLWGYSQHKGEHGQVSNIQPGCYVFPFCIQVPPVDHLPPTFDFGKYACFGKQSFKSHVRYRLAAGIDIPSVSDVKTSCPVRILSRIPITHVPGWNVASEQDDVKQVGCCCCNRGDVRVRARCLSPAVMIGGSLLFTAEIVNNSNCKVLGVELTLINHGVFHADSSQAVGSMVVARADFPVKLDKDEKFSNLNCSATPDAAAASKSHANGHDHHQDKGSLASKPFALVIPFDAAPAFKGKVIVSKHELVFRVRLEGSCVFDVRMTFLPTICTQEQDIVMTTFSESTILNPSGQPRSAVALQKASEHGHAVNFNFYGMDYNPSEQFHGTGPVSYPMFYHSQWDSVPSTINSYNQALMQAIVTHSASTPAPGHAAHAGHAGHSAPMGYPPPMDHGHGGHAAHAAPIGYPPPMDHGHGAPVVHVHAAPVDQGVPMNNVNDVPVVANDAAPADYSTPMSAPEEPMAAPVEEPIAAPVEEPIVAPVEEPIAAPVEEPQI